MTAKPKYSDCCCFDALLKHIGFKMLELHVKADGHPPRAWVCSEASACCCQMLAHWGLLVLKEYVLRMLYLKGPRR